MASVLRPVRGMRAAYIPLLLIYFSYGALGLIDVTRDMWIKESLTLGPAELAGIGVWLGLPWSIKMVFGQLVDSVPLFGSRRRSYIIVGAGLTACGLIVFAGAAGGRLSSFPADALYFIGALLIVLGTVVQDVVADAMSTEVVARMDVRGMPRSDTEIRSELGMVQVLGRLSLGVGVFSVAGLSGWLAQFLPRETVFLLGLSIPLLSMVSAFLIGRESTESQPVNWRILGGGALFGIAVVLVGIANVPYAQELVFVISMAVIISMLMIVTKDINSSTRQAIFFAAIIIFAFRATPAVGDGFFWWTLDVLKFDEAFYGTLRQTSALIGIVALWMFSRELTKYSVTRVLLWITIAGTILSLPNVGLYFGLHVWTEANLGIGPRTIALVDAATASPFAQLSMVPLLTLIAYYAPPAARATWFALMASLMNMALVAGQLQTKYLNQIFVVQRGDYAELGNLLLAAVALGFIIPLAVIILFGRKV